jgi:ribonucleoside-triphosphate reductase
MPDLSFKLLPDFIAKYKDIEAPFGFRDAGGNSLGEVTFSRTYSRLKDNGNKETWQEAVERVVDATYTIQKNYVKAHKLEWNDQKAQSSAKEFFDRLFNLKFTAPGRGLQQMGSPQVMSGNSASLQNCAVISTGDIERHDPGKVFEWAMLALMYGVGVGADMIGADKNIQIRDRKGDPELYIIPDSREGWADSLRVLLNSYLRKNTPIEFDYSLIRPKGAPLVSFGGHASGPEPLIRLHKTIEKIFDSRSGQTLDSETITDVFNLVGSCVIAGSTRRSAEIMMGEYDDEGFLDLKNPDVFPERNSYDPDEPGWAWASNNSVNVPVGADYSKYLDRISTNGEPGLIWMDVAKTRGRMMDEPDDKDRRIAGFNPCSEQPLESQEMCTLVTVHLQNAESKEDFLRTLKFAFLYAKTVTLMPTPWTKTNSVMQRNRRIGLSLTGITDVVDHRGLPEILEWMEAGYDEVRRLDHIYSEWLCVRESNRVTTIKPEGSVSLLSGASPGIHWGPGGRFYLRAIRFGSSDPMLSLFKAAGYTVEDDLVGADTSVVYFPMKTDSVRSEKEVSVFEKIGLAAKAQHHWSDNGVSVTVSFDPEKEKSLLVPALRLHEGSLKAVSFLPMSNTSYPQQPYTSISEEEYESYVGKIQKIDFNAIYQGVENLDVVAERFCSNDNCLI